MAKAATRRRGFRPSISSVEDLPDCRSSTAQKPDQKRQPDLGNHAQQCPAGSPIKVIDGWFPRLYVAAA
jgi:hypothetical protein